MSQGQLPIELDFRDRGLPGGWLVILGLIFFILAGVLVVECLGVGEGPREPVCEQVYQSHDLDSTLQPDLGLPLPESYPVCWP